MKKCILCNSEKVEEFKASMLVVDSNGLGAGVVDYLVTEIDENPHAIVIERGTGFQRTGIAIDGFEVLVILLLPRMDHRKLCRDGVLKECRLLLVLNLSLNLGIDEFIALRKGNILQGITGCNLSTSPVVAKPQDGKCQECDDIPSVVIHLLAKALYFVICW